MRWAIPSGFFRAPGRRLNRVRPTPSSKASPSAMPSPTRAVIPMISLKPLRIPAQPPLSRHLAQVIENAPQGGSGLMQIINPDLH